MKMKKKYQNKKCEYLVIERIDDIEFLCMSGNLKDLFSY